MPLEHLKLSKEVKLTDRDSGFFSYGDDKKRIIRYLNDRLLYIILKLKKFNEKGKLYKGWHDRINT